MNVAAYLRMSTDKQDDSIETQLGILMEYASRENLNIVGVYSDEAVSGGKSIVSRSGFKKLLSEQNTKGFTGILLVRLDRLSRNMLDFMQFEQEAAKHKLDIIYATEHYTNDASGWLLKHINALFAHHARTITGERTKEKCRQLAARGQWASGYPPLGFAYDKTTKILSIDQDRAEDVIQVFRTYIACSGNKSATAHKLNQLGVRTQRGGLWRDDGVGTILRNPIYRGRIRYADIDWATDKVPPIIPPDLLVRADILLQNTIGKRIKGTNSTHAYSGLLYCAQCGYSYKIADCRKGHEQYICRGRKEYGVCDAPKITDSWLDQLIPLGVKRALSRQIAILERYKVENDKLAEQDINVRRIANLRAVAKRKQEMYAVGIINDIDELKRELADIDGEIVELSKSDIKSEVFGHEELVYLATHINEYWEKVHPFELHKVLLIISPKIYIHHSPKRVVLDTTFSCGKIEVE